MVLGKLPVPGRPTILITVGQEPIALAVGAVGVVWTFLLSSILSPLSPSFWEMARYRLKYCLKGPLNPKQPTNQPTSISAICDIGSAATRSESEVCTCMVSNSILTSDTSLCPLEVFSRLSSSI